MFSITCKIENGMTITFLYFDTEKDTLEDIKSSVRATRALPKMRANDLLVFMSRKMFSMLLTKDYGSFYIMS